MNAQLCVLIASLTALTSPVSANAQAEASAEEPRVLLGAVFAITAEPDYRPGEMGILLNSAPLMVEWAFSERLGVRLYSIVNVELSSGEVGHTGGSLTLPLYLGADWTRGFYVGPSVGFAGNQQLGGHDLTLAVEGGYRWRIGERACLNLASQAGVSQITRPREETQWIFHPGFYPSLGYWF